MQYLKKNPLNISWSINLPIFLIIAYLIVVILFSYLKIFNDVKYFKILMPQFFFFIAIFVLKYFFKISFENLGISKKNILQNLSIGFFISIFYFVFIFLSNFLVKNFLGLENITKINFLLDPVVLITMVVFAPIIEEIIFRGVVFSSFKMEFGVFWGIVISSVIFMAVHLTFHPGALVLGIVCAYIFHLTNSCLPNILIHSVANLIAYMLPSFFPYIFEYLKYFYK